MKRDNDRQTAIILSIVGIVPVIWLAPVSYTHLDVYKRQLDQRMLNDMLPDFEGSKINACVDNIYRIWKENTIIEKWAEI